jgi:hypothetical protein
MRIYLLFAILGLMVVEALLLPRSLRDFRIMQKMRRETEPTQGLPLSLGPFAGYDTNGRPLALVTDDTHWIVPWLSIPASYPQTSTTWSDCARRSRTGRLPSSACATTAGAAMANV